MGNNRSENNYESENEKPSPDDFSSPSSWPAFPEERMVAESYKEWKEEHQTEKE